MREGWLGSIFFLLVTRVTILHETGFLHIKEVKIFGYEIVIPKGKKISKFSKKKNNEALVISIEICLWMTEQLL